MKLRIRTQIRIRKPSVQFCIQEEFGNYASNSNKNLETKCQIEIGIWKQQSFEDE